MEQSGLLGACPTGAAPTVVISIRSDLLFREGWWHVPPVGIRYRLPATRRRYLDTGPGLFVWEPLPDRQACALSQVT